MTPSTDRARDLPGDETGMTRTRLTDDLTHVYRAPAPPPQLDSAVLQALRASALERGRPQPRSSWARRLRRRPAARGARYAGLAALAAALLLAGSAAASALHMGSPTLVSAQSVLRRAAAR